MAYNLHIIRTMDFVRLDAKGSPDLIESRRALERVAKECVDRSVRCALLDVRDAHSSLSLADLYGLVSAFRAMGFSPDHRLAVLHRYSGGEKADFFADSASMRGWRVQSFCEFEDAVTWFNAELPTT